MNNKAQRSFSRIDNKTRFSSSLILPAADENELFLQAR
jgi:hypothetical protein